MKPVARGSRTRRGGALRRVVACAGAVGAALIVAAMPAGAAGPGSWGPQGIPYRNGIVCDDGTQQTALVSWTSAATAQPAFAVEPVTATGGIAQTPAVYTATTSPVTSVNGADPAALAYLFATAGRSSDASQVAEVAVIAAGQTTSDCLTQHGIGPGATDALRQQAEKYAGPYDVRVAAASGPLTLDSSRTVTAQVVSASGAPVPGLRVTFRSNDPAVPTSSGTTDAHGTATTTVSLPAGSTDTQLQINAQVSAPTGLVEMSQPGEIPLLADAAPTMAQGSVLLQVDTRAHPKVHAVAQPALALPGSQVSAQLQVTGMNGHAGTGEIDAFGPLPFDRRTGCASYDAAKWSSFRSSADTSHSSVVSSAIAVDGDGTYTAPLSVTTSGCYELIAKVTTTNAQPNVTAASGDAGSGAVLGVPPVKVSGTPAGHGIGVVGPQALTLVASGMPRVTLQGVHGELLGPRAIVTGTCPTSGWTDAPSAAALDGGDPSPSRVVTVTSDAVHASGCYGFRVHASLVLPGIGSMPILLNPSAPGTTMLVLAPTVAVTALPRTTVHIGSAASATVQVSGSLTQPGTIRLQLAHLPYTYRGCFGLDWSRAQLAPLTSGAPSATTDGDGSYTIDSPVVPRGGCWTVEPVLTLKANPRVHVRGVPAGATMTAFTAIPPGDGDGERDVGAGVHNATQRLLIAGAVLLAVIALTAGGIVLYVRRSVEPATAPASLEALDDVG